jgi:hypothetical protein
MEKPTLGFFATLGQYVYKYIDDNGNLLYVGKGNGDRCWAHVGDKGFNPENCYIVAKNLEKFEEKKDAAAFALESFFIATENPEVNAVSGHYKECFIMANLSEFFGKYQSEQIDPFEDFPEWYRNNYDSLRGRLSEFKLNSSTMFLKSAARNKVYMLLWYTPTEEEVKIGFEVNIGAGKERDEAIKQLKSWLKAEGYTKTSQDGVDYKLHVKAANPEAFIDLFNKFNQ